MLADTQESTFSPAGGRVSYASVFALHSTRFSQSKAVCHMGLAPPESQPARLGTGEILTICSKIKK